MPNATETNSVPAKDGYYWVTLNAASTPQIVRVLTGTAWGDKPSTESKTFVMFMARGRMLLDELREQYPAAVWSGRICEPALAAPERTEPHE